MAAKNYTRRSIGSIILPLLQISFNPLADRKRNLIGIQAFVVIATAYLLLFRNGLVVQDPLVFLMLLALLGSIFVFQRLPQSVFDHRLFAHTLVIVDTVFLSAAIAFNRESPWDLLLVFFFGIFIAATGENLTQIFVCCLVLSIVSIVVIPLSSGEPFQIDADTLFRIPLLFGASILYGYLVTQLKAERKRIVQLRQEQQHRLQLKEASRITALSMMEDARDARRQAERSLKRLAVLREIDLAIVSSLDLAAVLDILIDKIGSLLPNFVTEVWLFNRESKQLEPIACGNLDKEAWMRRDLGETPPLLKAAMEEKAPVLVSNVQTDPRILDPSFFRNHGLVSYLGVPLIAKAEALGVITFMTREEHQFSTEERDFFITLADQAAIAIHNSQLYEETKKQAVEMEKANKVKDEFLSVMSHELRTPLNVIMGYVEMIEEGMLGEINSEQEKALGKVISRSKELSSMITSILQATSIEAGAVKVESHEVKLSNFLDELRSAYEFPFGKELTLTWDYPSDLPSVKTDSERLKHILQNLINNAIKFTEKGYVAISARHFDRTGKVDFKVMDTGIGIPEESLPIIFEMFRQGDSSETRVYGGVGLGLYIVKKLTELLGGKIDVESEQGKGSTFSVCFPFHPEAQKRGGDYEETNTTSGR